MRSKPLAVEKSIAGLPVMSNPAGAGKSVPYDIGHTEHEFKSL
jgi:hypothetical protein